MGSGNVKKNEWKLGKTGLLIIIGGMTVLLCLAFFLGVRVGNHIDTYPEKIASAPQRFLALFWRPSKKAGEAPQTVGKPSEPDKTGMDLTFHDALTRQKLPSMEQAPVEEKKEHPDVVGDIIANAPEPALEESDVKDKTSESAKSAKTKKATVAQTTADKSKDGSRQQSSAVEVQTSSVSFVIHVASLKDKKKAYQIKKTVEAMGYASNVVKVELQEKGTWYRVVATGFETKAKAQNAAGKISQKVKTKCLIRSIHQDKNQNP